tara:strand:+ start:1917 stop:2822 length:906 start_codon:yes stop_codon:yes gene_type:complete
MPLITKAVPNLIQGVSQQSDKQRLEGQGREQENAMSSVVEGLRKRPQTEHLAQLLETAISSNSFIHFINRSESEKYVVLHDGTKLRIFRIHSDNEGEIGKECNIKVGVQSYKDGYTIGQVPVNTSDSTRLAVSENTITVTDFANIAVGTTIQLTNTKGETITFTSEAVGSSSPSTSLNWRPNTSNDVTADNIFTAINAHADFTVANPASNVVTITSSSSSHYLTSTTPSTEVKATTIGDSTFLLNNTKTADMTTDLSAAQSTDALVFVAQGDFGKQYKMDFGEGAGEAATYRYNWVSYDDN